MRLKPSAPLNPAPSGEVQPRGPVHAGSTGKAQPRTQPRPPTLSQPVVLPWGPLQVGTWLEKTDSLLLGHVEKDDVLEALPFRLESPGEEARVLCVCCGGIKGGGVPAGERGAEGVPRPGGAGAEGAPPPPRGLLGWGRGAWDAAGGQFPGGASGVRSLQMEGGVLESGRVASIYLPGAAARVGCGRRHQNETLAEAWVGGS